MENRGFFFVGLMAATAALASPDLQRAESLLDSSLLHQESGRPHAAARELRELEGYCTQWRTGAYESLAEAERGPAARVCVLAGAETLSRKLLPWDLGRARSLKAETVRFQTDAMPEPLRLEGIGRLRAALPPLFGQDFRASLVAWRFLERMAPDTPGIHTQMGLTFFRQGNADAAREAFARGVERAEPVAIARAARVAADGPQDPGFGWMPYLFSSPTTGFGLGVAGWDDRVADTRRLLKARVRVSTRLWAEGRVDWEDRQTLSPVRVGLALEAARRTQPNGVGVFDWSYLDAGPSLTVAAGPARLYGRYAARPARYGVLPAGQHGYGTHFFEVGAVWDDLDRPEIPRHGSRVELAHGWARDINGGRGYRILRLRGLFHHAPSSRDLLSLALGMAWAPGEVPQGLMPDLAADGEVAALAPWRRQQASVAGMTVRYRYSLLPWLRPGAFATVGATGGASFELERVGWGAGVDVAFVIHRSPRALPRWEFGIFNGSFIFQGGLNLAL